MASPSTTRPMLDVAVIVPTYNRAELIGETLHSILLQTLPPAEVVVVDDGSTDDTEAVVAKFAPAVRYMKIANSGECAARNAGVAQTTAEWLAFCDSDDLWEPTKLALQAKTVAQSADCEYCFTNFRTVVDGKWSAATKFDSSPADYWEIERTYVSDDAAVVEQPMFASLLRHQPIFPSTLMMSRRFFEAVGRWNEPLGRTRSVDLEFHLRCVAHSPIGVVWSPVVGIRKHKGNFSGDAYINTLGEIEVLRYVLAHHPEAKRHEQKIQESVEARSARAAAAAFAAGDYAKTRELLQCIPMHKRPLKLQIKGLIAHTPKPLAARLGRMCAAPARG